MLSDKTLKELKEWTQKQLAKCDAGHDWWHIVRVLNNAKKIHQQEGGDWDVIHLAVLLHDVADTKFFDEVEALMLIEEKLMMLNIASNTLDHVIKIIQNISFAKEWSDSQFSSNELMIVQDADRLDAMGAIGIARTFSYGGHKGRDLYNPAITPQAYTTATAYRNNNSPTINHFYEKLLLLKDKMNTQTGRKMATDRHTFMESYLNQFFKEWGDKSL
ncbi:MULTISPECIES: HD domain-containing protein [unclassified Carboxylicivirga]|uniref:HD domain-containing protein n=1 Tax=Carboxylicivirga TaxID=1628153 RepID=UPI003D345085